MAGTGQRFLGLLISMVSMLLLSSSSSSQALAMEFAVGGQNGWVVKPSEDYTHWAQRLRFQVNDTLHFRYKKESDSVLVVKKEDYDSCNPNNPIQKMDDGDSKFKLDHSGLYFFVTGNVNNCKNGQKLVVLVMAVRYPPPHKPAAPLPPPEKSVAPSHHTPSPGSISPASSPSKHSNLQSPAPSPTENSARVVGVNLGFVVALIMFITSFAGLV